MSSPGAAACPGCGAPLRFRFANAVQTTCEYCHSIVVRRDVRLEQVGVASAVPDNASPIQIGTEGVWQERTFAVAGRIVYEYDSGTWNEWHLALNDGSSAWLSDAQLEYSVTFLAPVAAPSFSQLRPGTPVHLADRDWIVGSITEAKYRGVEGDLPFEYFDKDTALFADLRTTSGEFCTIDGTETPPLVFVGRAASFEELRLSGLREFEGWTV